MFNELLFGNSVQNDDSSSRNKEAFLTNSSLFREYAQVFDGIGLLPWECNINVDPNATPVVYPPRRIPVALQDKVKWEFLRKENLGVIANVSTPTE